MDSKAKIVKNLIIYFSCFVLALYVFDVGARRLSSTAVDAQEPDLEEVDGEQNGDQGQTEESGADTGESDSEDTGDTAEGDEEDDDIPMPPPEQITVPGEKLFHLETSVGTQSVFNGKIPIHLYVKPFIDSSKAELEWEVPRGLEAISDAEKWFSMTEDEAETFTFYVQPQEAGHYEIVANVTAWRYDTNYVDSTVIEIDIDDNLLITPQTPEYKRNKTFMTLGVGVAIVLGIVGAFFGVKFGIKKFKMWMAED